ncbi:MAG: polysaccharide biosynthesis/export family protein [Acidobacteria bacterium]|nr:polysaccharide biosynthesis/export family protein [Acidobacteriota bacterium]
MNFLGQARGRALGRIPLWFGIALFAISTLLICTPAFSQEKPAPPPEVQAPFPLDAQRDYVIGPQDLLQVTILESQELSREVRVSADGTVGLPMLPVRIRVQGLMLSEAEALLTRKYQEAGILNQPNITISVKELQSKPVTVMGAVHTPGVFQISGQTRLLRVLTQAGGATPEAGTLVQVIRAGATSKDQIEKVRLQDLQQGALEANVPIYGGDTVNVIAAGAVYVVGAVNLPGRHVLGGDAEQLTVLRVVALSQDLKRFAKPEKTVILRKDPATGVVNQIPVNLREILARKAPDEPVMPGDVLFVPESGSKKGFARGLEAALQVATGLVIVAAK